MLAAGASRRLPGPKQLLRHRGVTLLRHAAEVAVAVAGRSVVVVLAAGTARLRAELSGLAVRIVENPDAARGLSTSLRAGLDALCEGREPDAALFLACDQPLLTADVLRHIVAAFAASRPPAVACAYAGTVGVPALFARSLFAELRSLEGDQGAKRVLERLGARVARVPFEPGGLDVDTPEDAAGLK